MARGIAVGGTSLPVTDASISFNKDPIVEQSMNGLGGEVLYKGVINSCQGTFSGAMRESVVNVAKTILETNPSPLGFTVCGEGGDTLIISTGYISSVEMSVKAGELAKISCSFVGLNAIAGAGAISAADYSGSVPVFYNSYTDFGTCSGFSIKIERPYAADDFVLGDSTGVSYSIYQSGETKVSGTITLAQWGPTSTSDMGALTFNLGEFTISVSGASVNTGAEVSVNGRGLIGKTYSWAAPSTRISIS